MKRRRVVDARLERKRSRAAVCKMHGRVGINNLRKRRRGGREGHSVFRFLGLILGNRMGLLGLGLVHGFGWFESWSMKHSMAWLVHLGEGEHSVWRCIVFFHCLVR